MGKPLSGAVVVLPFTVEESVILYTAGQISRAKLATVRARIRGLFA